jgi:hypothetical protein
LRQASVARTKLGTISKIDSRAVQSGRDGTSFAGPIVNFDGPVIPADDLLELNQELVVQVSTRTIYKRSGIDNLLNKQVEHLDEFLVHQTIVDRFPDAIKECDFVGSGERMVK